MTIHDAAAEIISKLDEAAKLVVPVIRSQMGEFHMTRIEKCELALCEAKAIDWRQCCVGTGYNPGEFAPDESIISDGRGNKWPSLTDKFTIMIQQDNEERGEYHTYTVGWRHFFAAVTLVSEEARKLIEKHFGGFDGFRV